MSNASLSFVIRHSEIRHCCLQELEMNATLPTSTSPWPHRWAIVLACATFPLLWVGGLVTTTDAGMAVPDWPTTYGYNMFLYPWTTWLTGPWDLFVEHGHRLLASAVGVLTIGLLVVLWRCDSRRWVRGLGVAALALVIFQGVLGGMRVLLDERTLAMLHGCTGPLFFGVTVALVVFTSRTWRESDAPISSPAAAIVRWLAVATCVLTYLQLMLGAVVRHVPVDGGPNTFALAVRFHLAMAAVLALHIALVVWLVRRNFRQVTLLNRLALLLVGLMLVQVGLGMATWVVKFAMPAAIVHRWPDATITVQASGWWQTHIITAHVAVGSALLGTSLALALVAMRKLAASTALPQSAPRKLGVAT
jgi:cytochrome c oxidase assembly protein subunit 15